jgi:hypothetical protein
MMRDVRSHERLQREPSDEAIRPHPPDERRDAVLELQRASGNLAVTRLLQRRDRPASTDAPGAHKDPGHHGKEPPKKAAADIHARVIKVDIDEGKTRVTIASGTEQGVQVGMPGSLVEDKGTEYADFTVETAAGGSCTAHVTAIPDQINRGPNAVIKASKFTPPESQEGKEF